MKYNFVNLLKSRSGPFCEFCRKNRKTVAVLCAGVFLLCIFELIAELERDSQYIRDDSGRVKGIRLESDGEISSVPLTVSAEKKGLTMKKELILTFGADRGGRIFEQKESPEEMLSAAIRDIAGEIESRKETTILLPQSLEDGIKLNWSRKQTARIPQILLLLPLTLVFFYRSSIEKTREAEKREKDGIRRELPAFNNQLLLLLGSGMIFSDAFLLIAEGFENRKEQGPLSRVILQIAKESRETGSSLVTSLGKYSKRLGVRELSRLANIITDNQHKGVNLTDKLNSESEILWTQRKKLAEERGRAAETKLAFPLALLLLVLILVTAAPAILQM